MQTTARNHSNCSQDENRLRNRKWKDRDLIGGVELVVHEASDDAGFPDGLIAEEDELVLCERGDGRHFSGCRSALDQAHDRINQYSVLLLSVLSLPWDRLRLL